MQNVLCIDLGTTTGFALATSSFIHKTGSNVQLIEGGSVSFKPSKYDGGGMRYLKFSQWLDELKLFHRFDLVYFESVRKHSSTDAAHVYGGLMATLTTWCERNHIAYAGVPVGTIKKHITGKGNASKDEVIAAVVAKGHKPKDDNHADALALLDLIISTNGNL